MSRTTSAALGASALVIALSGCARNEPRSPEPELTPASDFQTPDTIHDLDAPLNEPRPEPAPEPGPEPTPEPVPPPSEATPPPIFEGTGSFVDESGNTVYPD